MVAVGVEVVVVVEIALAVDVEGMTEAGLRVKTETTDDIMT